MRFEVRYPVWFDNGKGEIHHLEFDEGNKSGYGLGTYDIDSTWLPFSIEWKQTDVEMEFRLDFDGSLNQKVADSIKHVCQALVEAETLLRGTNEKLAAVFDEIATTCYGPRVGCTSFIVQQVTVL